MNIKKYWVYLLLCENGHYYTGYTNDLEKRYEQHLNGTSKCKYTRAFKPIKVSACWELDNKSKALKLEYLIKKLSHRKKENLAENPDLISVIATESLKLITIH
jgi:putative endonuclease